MANLKDQIDRLKSRLCIEKITATRSLKTPSGDIFCGISASFKHDGMGPGVDLLPSSGEDQEIAQGAMTTKDVTAAFMYLESRAYIMCLEAAVASGAYPEHVALNMKNGASVEFSKLIAKALHIPETKNDPADNGG